MVSAAHTTSQVHLASHQQPVLGKGNTTPIPKAQVLIAAEKDLQS